MTTTTAPSPTLRAHEVRVPADQRTHRRDVIRWALAHGRSVHRDALAALVGARAVALPTGSASVAGSSVWSGADLGALLWVGVSDWCAAHGADLPDGDSVATTLATYVRFLSAQRLLARGSDPVADLRRAIDDYGGAGRSDRHPSMRRRPAPVLPLA